MGVRSTMCIVTDLTNNIDIVTEPLVNSVFDKGITETIYDQRNDEGDLVYNEAMTDERKGVITCTWARWTPPLISLNMGYRQQSGALTGLRYSKAYRLTSGSIPAAAANFFGNGIPVDDPTATASYIVNGISTTIPRVASAGFDPAVTAGSFAVAADGAFTFSDDLVAARPLINIGASFDSTAAESLSQTRWAKFRLRQYGVIQDDLKRTIFYIEHPEAELDQAANSAFDFNASPVEIAFRKLDQECVPRLRYTRLEPSCAVA